MAARDFHCDRCQSTFTSAFNLKRHRARKRGCGDADPRVEVDGAVRYMCRFCNQTYASSDSLRNHIRLACKKSPNARDATSPLQEEIRELKNQIAEMREAVVAAAANAGPSITTIQQNFNIMAVNINSFGHENFDHITRDTIRGIFDEVLRTRALPDAAFEAIYRTASLLYSDPDHPENCNCFILSRGADEALVRTDSGWEIQQVERVLPTMTERSISTMFDMQPHEPFDQVENYGKILCTIREKEPDRLRDMETLRPILAQNRYRIENYQRLLRTSLAATSLEQ